MVISVNGGGIPPGRRPAQPGGQDPGTSLNATMDHCFSPLLCLQGFQNMPMVAVLLTQGLATGDDAYGSLPNYLKMRLQAELQRG